MNSVQYSIPAVVRRAAFTLVEVLIAASLTLLVVGGVLSILVMSFQSVKKTQLLDVAAQNTRMVQEHFAREISTALSKGPESIKRADGSDPFAFTFDISDGANPARFARLTYMVPVGDPLQVPELTSKSSSTLLLVCPPSVTLAEGDFALLGLPNTKDYLRIQSVADPAPGTQRNVTVTFPISIQAAALLAGTPAAQCEDVKANDTYVPFYRERRYEVAAPDAGDTITELQWWENTSEPASRRILSSSVSADQWHLFAQVFEPANPTTPVDGALSWSFKYLSEGSKALAGRKEFWEVSQTEGRIRARSGDPVNLNGPGGEDRYTTSSSTTTTSIPTTTIATTSSSTTSSSTIATTSIATTKATTIATTSKATTKATTIKTTKSSTTSKVTTSKKTTSKKTTSKVTTKATTKVTTKATTKVTTKATTKATTSIPTTKATTIKTTSKATTSKVTTKATTSKATTVPTTTIRDDG